MRGVHSSGRSQPMQSDHIEASQIRRFERQYEENPESFVFARLADAHRKAGNPERGLEILERGLERHAEYMSAHIVHARCLMDLGRQERAVEAWSRVLELDPQNLVALRALAELALAAGDRAVARTWAERLLHVDPLNEDAARLVADTAPDGPSGVDPSGLDAVPEREGTGATDDPGAKPQESGTPRHSGMITETMADLYVRQGLYEEAAYIFWELVKRQPADPNLRERLAQAQALASGASKREAETSVLSLSTATPEDTETSPEAEAAAGKVDGAYAAEHDPASSAGGPGRGGIRTHLQALIQGSADIEPLVSEDSRAEKEWPPADAKTPNDSNRESSASGFSDWLRSRRR